MRDIQIERNISIIENALFNLRDMKVISQDDLKMITLKLALHKKDATGRKQK